MKAKKKYFLLQQGDIIQATDEYYDPFNNRWMPIEPEFLGNEFWYDESKPVRRILSETQKQK